MEFSGTGAHDYTITHDGSASLCGSDSEPSATNSASINNDMLIGPNPFSNSINLEYTGPVSPDDKVEIFDLTGRSMYANIYTKQAIDLHKLKSGIYFLKFTNDKGEFGLKKIVKQ